MPSDYNEARWRQIDALFAGALERPQAERGAFLDLHCRTDAALREAVDRLIAADEQAQTFLEGPPVMVGEASEFEPQFGQEGLPGDTPLDPDPAVEPGLRFGPYRVERLLGRGGMGTVYLAVRDDGQFERQVALKLLHHGTRDPEALQRFRAERQILARLEHPAIARLYDGGESENGVPFLVMEHVEGLPLDVYCDRHRLTVEERLRLFRRLLEAVAYAHQNLLVHRDIKPANVLVTAEGEPKLLDFGIAKQLAGPADGAERMAASALTRLRLMTLVYASPEQVRGDAITTASDVYALGVVLYELLCGRSPYRLESDLPHELEAAVLHQEPERPSQALERVQRPGPGRGEPGREEIAAARRTSPRELRRRLRGDLDTIVLAALRKDPKRRYGSVVELAADLDRFLGAHTISARPDTALYRTAKFVRRHRPAVALSVAALVLIAALFASLLDQRDRAARERDKARQALSFLVEVFERADPYGRGAEKVSARELLDTGAERVSQELAGDPEVQAALMDAIGRASLGLGRIEEAAPLLGKALARRRETAPGSLELADSLENVAWLEFLRSDYKTAEPLMREAIALRRRLLGDRSPRVAQALNRLGTLLAERHQATDEQRLSEIEGLHREALAIYRAAEGARGPGVADSLFHLAKLSKLRGDLTEAERLDRQVLRINLASRGERHPETALSRRLLALTLIDRGKFDEAGAELRRALATQSAILPADHPDLALTRNDLALAQQRRGLYAEAEELFREVLSFHLATFGEEHAATAVVLSNLAGALQGQGELEEAAVLHDRALAVKLALFGERHIY
ncbi:MAG TPA: serine/threonine-protein kinase, partial [Thermoanaerobaculia bacterium]|nr:serine/threonine-protein kinase [Thermoanaerobaculia bacterium]